LDFTFRHLEILRAVVVAGSITKASHRIGLSQPSISQQLAKLEETLGVQLINRNRTGSIALTPAGEFWYRSAVEIMDRMHLLMQEHDQMFRSANLVLKLGVTPALRGAFMSGAARIARDHTNFTRFEMVYELTSQQLVEKLRMHQINFAVVAESALVDEASSFAIAPLFNDKIVWAVPAEVLDEEIVQALQPGVHADAVHPMLRHYVEIDPLVMTRQRSNEWFVSHLPFAAPTFQAPTFAASVEFTADGLASCHILKCLIPNLSQSVLQRVKLFEIDIQDGRAVLAMRKHLLSHPSFAHFYHQIIEFCRTNYGPAMERQTIRRLSDLMPCVQDSARKVPT